MISTTSVYNKEKIYFF